MTDNKAQDFHESLMERRAKYLDRAALELVHAEAAGIKGFQEAKLHMEISEAWRRLADSSGPAW